MRMIRSPEPLNTAGDRTFRVFLAGSIEMGKATDWQTELAALLDGVPVTLINPRRLEWRADESEQTQREQIRWELDAIKNSADFVIFYFAEDTLSPITLLELGLVSGAEIADVVCCPPGFWRRFNVEETAHFHNLPMVSNLQELADAIRTQAG